MYSFGTQYTHISKGTKQSRKRLRAFGMVRKSFFVYLRDTLLLLPPALPDSILVQNYTGFFSFFQDFF